MVSFLGCRRAAMFRFQGLVEFGRAGIIWRKNEVNEIRGVCTAVDLPARYYDVEIGALSGGNQQKALIARTLFSNAKCFLMFDPTRGVDVGTKQTIYAVIRKCAEQGAGILLIQPSSGKLTGRVTGASSSMAIAL